MASQTSFLADLASDLYDKHHQGIAQLEIIFPNERAGQVFKQCLAVHLSPKTALPKVLSLEAWLQRLSPLKQAQSLLLTHLLYQIFQGLQPREESFEQFYSWGSLLLEDFDVIDKYLVDAVHLFTDLSKHKELSLSYDYLTEAQRTAIQSFWKKFEQRLSTHQQGFLHLWKLLPQVYQHFKKSLQAQGIGYQGVCHRAAYEVLLQGAAPVQHNQLVFAGFNALTPVEERIFVWYQENRSTAFYWDIDAYYMEDTQQEAGLYLRAHQQKPYFQASFVQPFPRHIAAAAQEIYITEVASEVGQAQVMGAQLQALMEAQGANFVPGKVAIVVANESLRAPVLHDLSLLDKVSISTHLGYPLKNTTTYRLLEHLLALRIATTQAKYPAGYLTTQHVLAVLKHPHVMGWNPTQVQATISRLQASKRSYVTQEDLIRENALYANIFRMLGPQDHLLPYLMEGLQCIEAYAQEAMLRPLEKMALQQLLQQLGSLQALLPTPTAKSEALQSLLQQQVHPVQLPIDRPSTEGVQVLDMLATQTLDFDYVFIVGMNEGHLPAQGNVASLIPYNLRKGYGLPTADQHQAALYAYHFYRLLQRARQVYITYSTQTTSDGQGEMSRYLLQLLYESKLHLKKQVVTRPIHLTSARPIVIPKKDIVLHQLRKYILQADGNVQPLTPSALNTYLDCSLRFYFQYLAQLKAPAPPQQATHALVFGNLLHKVMEKLYTPLMTKQQGQLLQSQDLEALQKKISTVVQEVFSSMLQHHQLVELQGDNAIAQAAMIKLVNRILVLDQAHAPFVLIGLEMGRQVPLTLDFSLNSTTSVRLRGIIDRVDWKAGVFRVLDYKTGVDEKKIKSVASLFDQNATRRNKAAFQTFFYAWLFQKKGLSHVTLASFLPVSQTSDSEGASIMPGLFNTRQIFNTHFDPRFFFQQSGSRTSRPLENIIVYQKEWEEGLRQTLTELLNPAVPFAQTVDEARCVSCPYKGICERH